MDIAALSSMLSHSKLSTDVGISVLKLAKDSVETQASQFTDMLSASTRTMEQSLQPHIGSTIDLRA